MQNQQQPQQSGPTAAGIFNLFYLAVSGHAACFTPFMRHSFGRETFAQSGMAAAAILFLYSLAHPMSSAMVDFGALWVIVVVCQRVKTLRLLHRGVALHSRYEGYPWLAMKMPFVSTIGRARGCELLICLFGGALLCGYDPVVGQFVMSGFISLLLKNGIDGEIERKQVQQMRDAEMEQRWLVENYQRGRF